jgi:hypothetical protein
MVKARSVASGEGGAPRHAVFGAMPPAGQSSHVTPPTDDGLVHICCTLTSLASLASATNNELFETIEKRESPRTLTQDEMTDRAVVQVVSVCGTCSLYFRAYLP